MSRQPEHWPSRTQAIFGLPVEMMVGTKPMLVVYNVGVAAGALTLGFMDAYRSVVGGSGGVYTLVGVHLANIVLNWHVMGTAGIPSSTI
jgi:membrane associated rhomboid family serine protease